MIQISATAESVQQARQLMDSGIDNIYIGDKRYGLRLPASFTLAEMQEIIELAHAKKKTVTIALNAIFHKDKMSELPAYLHQLEQLQPDYLEIGDTGVLYLLKQEQIQIPFIMNNQMLMTNAKQINFWGKKGAVGAVLGREVPFEEMIPLSAGIEQPLFAEILVYGATCIHQSLRPLVTNYYNFITPANNDTSYERGLFISEPNDPETHYSIFEDEHGTHIFANNDLNLMNELDKLHTYNYDHWKLDGLYTKGDKFVEIAKLFVQAKEALEAGDWSANKAALLSQQVEQLHPVERGLDDGFFHYSADDVK